MPRSANDTLNNASETRRTSHLADAAIEQTGFKAQDFLDDLRVAGSQVRDWTDPDIFVAGVIRVTPPPRRSALRAPGAPRRRGNCHVSFIGRDTIIDDEPLSPEDDSDFAENDELPPIPFQDVPASTTPRIHRTSPTFDMQYRPIMLNPAHAPQKTPLAPEYVPLEKRAITHVRRPHGWPGPVDISMHVGATLSVLNADGKRQDKSWQEACDYLFDWCRYCAATGPPLSIQCISFEIDERLQIQHPNSPNVAEECIALARKACPDCPSVDAKFVPPMM
ncbi:hypothetical protein BD626DRAFT_564073 [Schizophyllum amplum]|uniref:Uncharacterized protein n=1 Tax=Schizophyllum amplum TaxID=97359 RepID=A0A550D088_9AGAR|nr:hypothetical protein BD626DRAFT_564073 [Auriculariopsis ampla]